MKNLFTLLIVILTTFTIYGQCWLTVSSGENHTVAIKDDGTLWAWGDNTYGQLGVGSIAYSYLPLKIGTETDWKIIATGKSHTVALKTNGTLWTWGNNNTAQLGNGLYGSGTEKNVPTQIGTDTDWKFIFAGNDNTMAIKSNNTLWVWGDNFFGQLGDGTNSTKFTPTQIGSDMDWKTISIEHSHTLAIKNNGTLWSWGKNDNGQLGDGNIGGSAGKNTPTQIGTDADWSYISGGGYHSLAIKSDGTLWSWGYNYYGQLGTPFGTYQTTPLQIGLDNNWQVISAGEVHSLAIKSDGTLWGCGINDKGQLGNGNYDTSKLFIQIGNNINWSLADSKRHNNLVMKSDGTLWGFGINNAGQLGDNTIENKNSPIQVSCSSLDTENFSLKNNSFIIYPNPSNNLIFLGNTFNQFIDKITVVNLLGKTVIEQVDHKNLLNVQNLQNGMYLLNISSGEKSYQYKFIKK